MSHWLDQAAAGLASGAMSRREVLRRGGAAAGGALLGSITTPVAAFAAGGGTRCPDGHHCGPREQCCRHDCCDKRTEQCCEGRCVSKGRECCRESRSDEGRVCELHQSCCPGDGKCYSPADDDCCFEGVCYGAGKNGKRCCGLADECCLPKDCCGDQECCDEDRPKCCRGHGRVGPESSSRCCGADQTCCTGSNGATCCEKGEVCCGTGATATCCPKGKCHNAVCGMICTSAAPNCGFEVGTVSNPGTQCCIAEGAATGPCCPMGVDNIIYGVSVCHQNSDGNPDGTCCPPGQASYPCNVGPPTTFHCCPVSHTASGGCCEYPPGTYTCCAPDQTCRVPAAFGSPPYGCV